MSFGILVVPFWVANFLQKVMGTPLFVVPTNWISIFFYILTKIEKGLNFFFGNVQDFLENRDSNLRFYVSLQNYPVRSTGSAQE